MKFADLFVGQLIKAGPYRVDAASIIEFATKYDPQPFHTDPLAAEDGPWRGVIASGWQTCCIAMRLVADEILNDSGSLGSPGIEYIRWPQPVRDQDELRLTVEVLEVRRSRSRGYGISRWRWILTNQEQQIVLDMVATSFFVASTAIDD